MCGESVYDYSNPLLERYASHQMSSIFSAQNKFSTWRRLWIALAESQQKLGLGISDDQLREMREHIDDIDYERARQLESQLRHDVMAHIHIYGECCPKAKPIIHLGATSAFVGDNTDLIQMRDAFKLTVSRLTGLISKLKDFALTHADHATLGFTHFQPAQLVTVGKRATLWIYDLTLDFDGMVNFIDNLPFLGVKGTTGTQASFLELLNGDHEKVKQLDREVSERMGFTKIQPVSGQTYSRKIDAQAAALLCGLAQSLHKMANDIRLLQNLKEIEEPFEKGQVGSSAMAYKRNPMRSERMTSLCRYMISLSLSPAMTASEQWFERTLDDSANKRLSIPEMFLAADASLIIASNICGNLVVYGKMIERHLREELPFMATENIIMEGVKKGGDRQELHERIRIHSMEAAKHVKMEGRENDLLDRIANDQAIGLSRKEIDLLLNVENFIGRAPQQVREFIGEYVDPLLQRAAGRFGAAAETQLKV
jgi:adenylosuccinate lyase